MDSLNYLSQAFLKLQNNYLNPFQCFHKILLKINKNKYKSKLRDD